MTHDRHRLVRARLGRVLSAIVGCGAIACTGQILDAPRGLNAGGSGVGGSGQTAGGAGGGVTWPVTTSPAMFDPDCTPQLGTRRQIVEAGGGSGQIAVMLPAACAFDARAVVDWIKIASGGTGMGDGSVGFTVAANSGPDRMGVVAINDDAFVVVQRGTGPLTTHPRLWVRASDLDRLRARAVDSNSVWVKVKARGEKAKTAFDTMYFPGGKAASPWPDPADPSVAGISEALALDLAFYSLVSPDVAVRSDAARRAHDVFMQVMKLADGTTGFGAANFPSGDRFRYNGEQWALVADWIYPLLTAAEKPVVRRVFLKWAEKQASYSAGTRPRDLRDDPALINDRNNYRWAANNWQTAMGRDFLLESLVFDDADDPPVNAGQPATAAGNSLRAYRDEALHGVMFQQQHMFAAGGDGAGGVPPEGAFEYGAEATAFFFDGLLGLYTAGYLDWEKYGVGVQLLGESYYRNMLTFYPHGIAPVPEGKDRQWAAAIDEQTRDWFMTGNLHVPQLGPMAVLADLSGDVVSRDRARWLLTEALPGGAAKRDDWINVGATEAALGFLLFDPALPAPRDYRADLAQTFRSPALGRISSRTSWAADARWFYSGCAWKTIDHQIELCGSFMFWRKGDFVVDPRKGYSDTGVIDSPDYHNDMAVQKVSPPDADFEKTVWTRGGQSRYNDGDPSQVVDDQKEFLYVADDATPLHNRAGMRDIGNVSRALVWLRPDAVVIYDRVSTGTGRWKKFWLNVPSKPQIAGRVVHAQTRSGQGVRLDTLLPTTATVAEQPWEADSGDGAGEQMTSHLLAQDPTSPPEFRALHVLQAYDQGAAEQPTMAVNVSAGAFQAARVGDAIVLFATAAGGQSADGIGYTLPAGVSLQIITGLRPGDQYDVAVTGSDVHVKANGAETVDAAGVLVLRAP